MSAKHLGSCHIHDVYSAFLKLKLSADHYVLLDPEQWGCGDIAWYYDELFKTLESNGAELISRYYRGKKCLA